MLGRIYSQAFSLPLGYGKPPSRFSDPPRLIGANRFGVAYRGSSLKVCFLEGLLRDAPDGAVGDLPMCDISHRIYGEPSPPRALQSAT
jgi:hypothetical protein